MNQERIYQIILGPVVSEKATSVAEASSQVVLKVRPDATKLEIKKAVEVLFDAKVESVTVSNVKGKTRRTRHGVGKRSDWKKAYVRLEQGQDIDFASAE